MTNPRSISTKRRRQIVERQHWLCAICGNPIKPGSFEVDHIQAVEHDGDGADDNLRAICKPCHRVKTNQDNRGRHKRDKLRFGKARKSEPMPGSRDSRWKKNMDGTVTLR